MTETRTAENTIWSRSFDGSIVTKAVSLTCVLFVLAVGLAEAQTGNTPSSPTTKTSPDRLLQPMNIPMDELGVTGHDTTLCSDRWYSCTTYDRQQFDQKYPGRPLNELLRYGEPDWPDRERQERDRTDPHDSLDFHDRLDKD
jgi:hypothetical protein